jgi:hypothetical protein
MLYDPSLSLQHPQPVHKRHKRRGSGLGKGKCVFYSVVILIRISRSSQIVQDLVRTSSSSFGIIIVIGSSFPPFLIAIIPLGWMYSRFMRLMMLLFRPSDCILTPLTDTI